MPDDFSGREGEPAERGRFAAEERPAAGLPMSALQPPGYASPHARYRWRPGFLLCGEIGLEPPERVEPRHTMAEAASRLLGSQAGYLPVVSEGRLSGAVLLEDLLSAAGKGEALQSVPVSRIAVRRLPTVRRETLLADAVRLMIANCLRRIPVVDTEDHLLGFVTLSEAAALADRDPAVRDVLGAVGLSPSFWARRML
jgi:CBS domain-containing protein